MPTGVSCDESGGGCHPDLGPDHGRMSGDIGGWSPSAPGHWVSVSGQQCTMGNLEGPGGH